MGHWCSLSHYLQWEISVRALSVLCYPEPKTGCQCSLDQKNHKGNLWLQAQFTLPLCKPKLCEQGKTYLSSIPPNLTVLRPIPLLLAFSSPRHKSERGLKVENFDCVKTCPRNPWTGPYFLRFPLSTPLPPAGPVGSAVMNPVVVLSVWAHSHEPWQLGNHKLGQELTLKTSMKAALSIELCSLPGGSWSRVNSPHPRGAWISGGWGVSVGISS